MGTARNTYEDFRLAYEDSEGEKPLKPWNQLSEMEQRQWEEQWRKYTGELDTTDGIGGVKHGNPAVTENRKPRS